MKLEHHLRLASARCLSLLQRYHEGERTEATRARMVAEVEVVIGWLMELRLPPGATADGVLRPVEAWLLDRYGPEVGPRLNQDFLEAFGGAGMPLIFRASGYLIEELRKTL